MSLLMYKDGILSADRRVKKGYSSPYYNGLENHSKLFFSEDKKLLIGCVGKILSQAQFVFIKNWLDRCVNVKQGDTPLKDWMKALCTIEPMEELFRQSNGAVFMFYKGHFLIFDKNSLLDDVQLTFGDLNSPRVEGMGIPAATMLIRSGKDFSLQQFYRIVSAVCEGVGTVFDQVAINEVEGFS